MPQLALGIIFLAFRLASNWAQAPRSSDWPVKQQRKEQGRRRGREETQNIVFIYDCGTAAEHLEKLERRDPECLFPCGTVNIMEIRHNLLKPSLEPPPWAVPPPCPESQLLLCFITCWASHASLAWASIASDAVPASSPSGPMQRASSWGRDGLRLLRLRLPPGEKAPGPPVEEEEREWDCTPDSGSFLDTSAWLKRAGRRATGPAWGSDRGGPKTCEQVTCQCRRRRSQRGACQWEAPRKWEGAGTPRAAPHTAGVHRRSGATEAGSRLRSGGVCRCRPAQPASGTGTDGGRSKGWGSRRVLEARYLQMDGGFVGWCPLQEDQGKLLIEGGGGASLSADPAVTSRAVVS
ncbi:hypothetical protein FQN60_013278 [Etheostoma spectabile]|uniref:Uncharacterized protein n=1 Tax=Etheostoma spectabile TaxID=54343 RepID=A0A5J5DA26_9PERO|nr:hypothetical protein FQN60_013278 [Etheostoma spectabile]